QVELAQKHIQFAEESHKLSDQRFKQNIKGRSPSEVLLALRSLGGARLEYIQAVRDLNRAQLRLFVLVGTDEKYPRPRLAPARPRALAASNTRTRGAARALNVNRNPTSRQTP